MSFKDDVSTHLKENLNETLESYFQGDPEFNAEKEAELLRYTAALRRIVTKSIKLNGSQAELTALADAAEQLEQQISPHSGQRALPAYSKVFDFDNVGHTNAYSPVTGRANAAAPPVFTQIIDNKVICKVTLSEVYEGPPGCVHGGVVAMIWDHVLATAGLIDGVRGPTAYLHIDYRKPTPIKQGLRFEAWIDRVEGKKAYTQGICYGHKPNSGSSQNSEDEVIITEANGLFLNSLIREIAVTDEHLKQKVKR